MTGDGTGTTVYVDGQDDSKIRRSGFLITGRDATKGVDANLFAADAGGTTVYVDDAEGEKIRRSGFLITGRDATKADRDQYMAVTSEKVNLSTTAFTVTERNEELGTVQSLISVNTSNDGQTQVVVHTDIALEDEVVEVADAPMQGEYAMAVTDSMWFTPAKEDDYRFSPEYNQLMTIYGEGEYAPAVSVKFEYGNNSIVLPSLFFDGEGNPTSSAKKAAVVVFDTPDDGYGEGVYIIRAFEPIANKTIEFGLMNTDGEFVKITAQINSAEGKPFQLPVGDYEGGKIISEGDNYYGAPIMLKAISDKGKIFAGWTMNVPMQLPDNVGTQNVKIYVSECPLNGMALIDEWMFGGDETDLTPEFANPELYVSNSNSKNYHSGFSNEDPLKTIDLAVSKIAQLAFEQPANGKLDWTIKVVDNVYGAQTIPAEINIPNQPNQPDNILKIQLEDVVNSIRLTSISGDAQIDGSWWYSEGDWYYGAATGSTPDPVSALNILSPVPVTIDNLTVKRGHAALGGGIFIDENANITLADGVNITGNDAQEYGGGLYVNGNACVTIADGVKIVGNTASENGGGVYVGEGANLYMTGGIINSNKANNGSGGGIYATDNSLVVIGGSAVIGDTEITDASEINDDNCANQAAMGGGIYSTGDLFLGYKLKDDATELIADNLVKDEESSVTIQGNYANTTSNLGGGGVYVGGKFDMASGSISGNQANNGGGVMATATGEAEFTMTGGEIAGNSAAKGSGVYVGTCTFTMSGDARVNAGNDVYLASRQKITIGGTFSGSDIVATITPTNYNTALEIPVLDGDSELVESECGRFAVTPGRTQSGGDLKYWRVGSDGKLQELIGTKAVPDAVGDIVFTDGSAVPYSEDLTLTQGQKNSAVAVIFDAENKKGVALGQSSDQTRWCANASLSGYGDVTGACGQDNGWDNTNAIYELSDFEMNSGNYPPFEYAKGYTAGGYTDWYIPAIHELQAIQSNNAILNQAINKVGGTSITLAQYTYYWSSSQDERGGNNSNYAYYVRFDNYAVVSTTKVGDAMYRQVAYSRCVRQFGGNNNSKLTTYYVAPNATNGGIGSDDNNGLSGNAPFATIGKAISMMTEAKNYLVVICGGVKGNQTIENIPDGSTLTIMGNRNNEADALNADNSGTVLEIKTSVPVTIKNLKITNGGACGIKMEGNADVTLGAGALVVSNSAGQDGLGGGVYIAGGKLTMLSGSEVSSNKAMISSGGGIYIAEGATFDMKGGKIESNQAGHFGQSVYVGGTFNMSGGTIESNPSYSDGGDVRVNRNAVFNIKGTAKIDNNDYVLLDSHSDEYATINIVGALEGENRVAIIKPLNYDDGIPLLTKAQDYDGELPVSRFDVAIGEGYYWSINPDGTLKQLETGGKATMKSLNGVFSVSNDKKVQFSSGNLRYFPYNGKRIWEFAENQKDRIGVYNTDISDYYNGWIDLFGWGTSGNEGKNPWEKSTSKWDYYYDTDIAGTDYDWGEKITKDYNTTEQWRTLTADEWTYLLSRNNKNLRAPASVDWVKGLIILPDDWSSDGMPAFNSQATNYDVNDYTSEQWAQMEAKGAVFLPCGGYRIGSGSGSVNSNEYYYQGYYWSSSKPSNATEKAKLLCFDGSNNNAATPSVTSNYIYYGASVRLVHDYEKDYSEIFDFSTDGTTATITKYKGSEEDVTIPETVKIDGTVYTVTAFKGDAFNDCNVVKSVTIPQSVTTISGSSCFGRCSGLEAINVASENAKYYSVDGVLYEKSSDEKSILWRYPSAKTGEEFTIPDNVKEIKYNAFRANQFLGKVTISKDVTSIHTYSFDSCVELTEFIVDDNNQSYSSSDGILYDKDKTTLVRYPIAKSGTSYDVPSYVESLLACAFAGCANLESVSIHDGVEMANCVFQDNKVIKSVTLPTDLVEIPGQTFQGCSSLTSVEIPSSVTSIEHQAFQSCLSLTTITIPNGVTTIEGTIFSGCSGLTSIYIPKSLTTIEDYAFYYCSKLSEVKYGGSEEDRSGITIGTNNDKFNNATWSYNQEP
ncbi:MAG: leucine-rich repeat protein [Salinivirgaceae bacterium]|nr:leucine-rich repeat protein [Salinivirgaceae bacterium]